MSKLQFKLRRKLNRGFDDSSELIAASVRELDSKDQLIAELVEALETVPVPYWGTDRLAVEQDWCEKRDELIERVRNGKQQ